MIPALAAKWPCATSPWPWVPAMRTVVFGGVAWRRFFASLPRSSAPRPEALRAAAGIVRAVRRGGDAALCRLTERFDGVRLLPRQLRVPPREIAALAREADPRVVAALRAMARRIEAFHRRQLQAGFRLALADGSVLEEVVRPIASAGLYVPGGAGAYPSSVLMNAIPARVAGVKRLVVVTPPRTLEENPAVAAAILVARVEERVFRVGGAQAIAALAYGTRSVPAVDKIVGPGNAYVAAAKRLVRGQVEIDSEAGPSEVAILADATADPGWVAADLLAQAEHGSGDETVVLVTTSRDLAAEVLRLVADGVSFVANAAKARRALRPQRRDRPREGPRGGRRGRERARSRARRGDDAERPESGPRDRGRGGVRRALGAGGGRGLRRGPEPRPPHGRGRALRLASLRARLPAAAERRDDDPGRPRARGGGRRPRGGRRGLPRPRPERPHAVRGGVMDPLRHVKPAVRSLAAYTLTLREAPVKINQNENPWDLPEAVKRRVLEKALARPWSRYPDFDPKELLEALARFSGWRADGILAGNGSNEAIEALLMVTVGPGTKVVIPEPTFTLYALMTTILGGEPVRVPMVSDGLALGATAGGRAGGTRLAEDATGDQAGGVTGASACAAALISERRCPRPPTARSRPASAYDVEALLAAQRASGASVTIVCSPNNPTGTSLAPGDVERLCRESDSLVVIDEAYHEFAGRTVVPLLERHPNLVVLRTFSKAMALAGLRVGYLLASPELVREINKARLPYNVNFFSQAAALAALEEKEALATSVAPAGRRSARGSSRGSRTSPACAPSPPTRTSSCSSASPRTRRRSSPRCSGGGCSCAT